MRVAVVCELVVPLTVTDEGESAQVTKATGLEHASATEPPKPPAGVTAKFAVVLPPAESETVMTEEVMENGGTT